jgi:hypothetical protein
VANEVKSFWIRKYIKSGKRMVLELDDEVEYIVDDKAILEIEAGNEQVRLIRVIDRAPQMVSARRIRWAILKDAIVDYIDASDS